MIELIGRIVSDPLAAGIKRFSENSPIVVGIQVASSIGTVQNFSV